MSYSTELAARNDQQLDMLTAIALVHSNAKQEWKDEADQVVRSLCQTRQFFTANDVWERMTKSTPDGRALGQVIINASKAGLCRKTDRYEPSRIKKQNMRPIAIWESLSPKA